MSGTSFGSYFTTREYGRQGGRPIFIFGGWLTRPFYYSRIIKQLTSHGFTCVLYIPRRKLIAIGTHYSQVVEATELAVQEVRHRLAEYDGDQAAVFGISIGTTFALEAAKQCRQIKKIALLTPAGDFEKHVDIWQHQPYFKRIVASQPTTPAESGKILNKVGALKKLHLLKGKEVLIGYAKDDKVLHISIAKDLAEHIRAMHINPTVLEVKGGHNAGLFRYWREQQTYLSFFIEA